MIKVVFIDIDNTLLSFTDYVKESMREGFPSFGLKPYTEAMFPTFKRINNALWRRLEQGMLTLEELEKCRWDLIFKELGIDFDGVTFEAYFKERLYYSAIPEKGAEDMLKYLSRRYTLCVASNGPYEQQMNRLRIGKMNAYFTHYFISSRIGAQKPSRQFFDRCFGILREAAFPDLVPEEGIIIGDSVSSDISGGFDYGMHTCLYQKGDMPIHGSPKAEYVISSLAEIENIL